MRVEFQVTDDGKCFTVKGQVARTLLALLDAGEQGVTALSVSSWGYRLAHYILCLRKLGLIIEMEKEPHDGLVSGWHGRYRLRTSVLLVSPLDKEVA